MDHTATKITQAAIATYQRIVDRYQNEIDSLNARYSGVRPGWVSADLAIYARNRDRSQAEIDRLRAKISQT